MWTDTPSRRHFLQRSWQGIGSLALSALLARADPRPPNFAARVKNVIFLFMSGGVSQVDTFDHKPLLATQAGKRLPMSEGLEGEIKSFLSRPHAALPSPFEFKRHGQSGRWVSSVFRHLPGVIDDLAFVHGVKVDSNNHSPATMHVNTGSPFQGNPSVGAWVSYGLGSENDSLPSYVVLHDPRGGPVNGSAVWQSGYLPASFQGTPFRSVGTPILNLAAPADQSRAEIDFIQHLNRRHAASRAEPGELEGRIAAYELAFRMQAEAPGIVDLDRESPSMHRMYGLDQPHAAAFGRQCLMARRLVEKGVRFVLLVHGWENGIYSWDHHLDLEGLLPARAAEVDQPVAALLRDLKQRGLWNDTLVVWVSEMGRTPFSEGGGKRLGRNHNQYGMVTWFAGGGVKAGADLNQSDEFGVKAEGRPVPIRDVHATILSLMGLDDSALTYLHEGRYKRLTDTGGTVLKGILA
jgi:hypothetical protein